MSKVMGKKLFRVSMGILIISGLLLRLWNINFGLPHSHYADEPELGEFAIKYTYELKTILANNDIYKLVPESYVYGTLPVYLYTFCVMVFSKSLNILSVAFSKTDLYVFMRVINAVISLMIVQIFYLLLKRLNFKYRQVAFLVGTFLTALNWKLIVHAHYLNHDIVITLFILVANLMFLRYLQERHRQTEPETDTLYTLLFALFFGLGVSTKITVLLTFPVYLAVFAKNRDYRNLFASVYIVLGVFIVTNPFSWLFIGDFFSRLIEMRITEAGLVFDSVDYSPFKYIFALAWILTAPSLMLAFLGIIRSSKEPSPALRQFYLAMLIQVVSYLLFFSLQSRRVDRWMLPIVPNLLVFAVIAIDYLTYRLTTSRLKGMGWMILLATFVYYTYFPFVLLNQFQRNTPKSAGYIWAKENLPSTATKFGITEEGLDPLNKLPLATVWQFNAYESKGGQFVFPPDPHLYDYILVSSRPAFWSQNPQIVDKYPYYGHRWQEFYLELAKPDSFEVVKVFETTTPNLIPLSSVRVYKNISRSLLK